MDGTLVYFQIDFIRARKNAINVMELNGIPKGYLNTDDPIRSSVQKAKKYYIDTLFLETENIANIMKQVNQEVIDVEMEAAILAKPIETAESLLRFGQQHHIKQIICTYNTHKVAVTTLKNANLLQFIDEIYGRDDVHEPKPSVKHIEHAIEKYNIQPDEAVVIGDHSTDISLGKAFGCMTIGVLTSHNLNSVEEADYKVKDTNLSDEIIRILQNNFGLS